MLLVDFLSYQSYRRDDADLTIWNCIQHFGLIQLTAVAFNTTLFFLV